MKLPSLPFRRVKIENKPMDYKLSLYKNYDFKLVCRGTIKKTKFLEILKKTGKIIPQVKIIPKSGWGKIEVEKDLIRHVENKILNHLLPRILEKERKKFKPTLDFVTASIQRISLEETKHRDLLRFEIHIKGVWYA